jgi:hypothetical protein
MAQYWPIDRKKKEILKKRINLVIRLTAQNSSLDKLKAAAEEVRAAKIRMFSVHLKAAPESKFRERFAALAEERDRWRSMTLEQIVEECRTYGLRRVQPH